MNLRERCCGKVTRINANHGRIPKNGWFPGAQGTGTNENCAQETWDAYFGEQHRHQKTLGCGTLRGKTSEANCRLRIEFKREPNNWINVLKRAEHRDQLASKREPFTARVSSAGQLPYQCSPAREWDLVASFIPKKPPSLHSMDTSQVSVKARNYAQQDHTQPLQPLPSPTE